MVNGSDLTDTPLNAEERAARKALKARAEDLRRRESQLEEQRRELQASDGSPRQIRRAINRLDRRFAALGRQKDAFYTERQAVIDGAIERARKEG